VTLDQPTKSLVFNPSIKSSNSARQGLAHTIEPLRFSDSPELSILVELKSQGIPNGLGVILTLLDEYDQPPLMIAQWQNHLAMRSRRIEKSSENQYIETGLKDCFHGDQIFELLISSGQEGTKIFVDGELVKTTDWYHLKDPNRPFGGRLILGNNATATQPWQGILKRVSLFEKELTPTLLDKARKDSVADYYNFDYKQSKLFPTGGIGARLEVPKQYAPLKRDRLSKFDADSFYRIDSRRDIIINLLGFMPFGFIVSVLSIRFTRKFRFASSIYSVAAVFFASLLIETLQAYLPSRDSSLLDLLCNTIGGSIAVLLSAPILKRVSNKSDSSKSRVDLLPWS